MTRLRRLWTRNTRCRALRHELDSLLVHVGGPRRCLHCELPMPEPIRSSKVGDLFADAGD